MIRAVVNLWGLLKWIKDRDSNESRSVSFQDSRLKVSSLHDIFAAVRDFDRAKYNRMAFEHCNLEQALLHSQL